MMAPVPFGSRVILPLAAVVVTDKLAVLVKRGEVTDVPAARVVTPLTAPALILTELIVLVLLAVLVEARVRAPADVILFEVVKKLTSPVEPEAMVIAPAPLAPMVRASSVALEMTERATPAPDAADLTLIPVTLVPVEASTWKTGLVAPFRPATNAVADAEVMVWAAEVTTPAVDTSKEAKSIAAAPLEPMVPVVMAMLFDPAFKALSIVESEASMASTIPEAMAPELVMSIALSTMVEPVALVSALSRSKRASVFKS